jgi:hypothetical protein
MDWENCIGVDSACGARLPGQAVVSHASDITSANTGMEDFLTNYLAI